MKPGHAENTPPPKRKFALAAVVVLAAFLLGVAVPTKVVTRAPRDVKNWIVAARVFLAAPREMPAVPLLDTFPPSDEPLAASRLIAHACGEIDSHRYTNCAEALEQSIAAGFSMIEIDLLEAADGVLVAAHEWADFDGLTGTLGAVSAEKESADAFRSRKILNRYTPLTIREINRIFRENPRLILVTDKVRNFRAIREQVENQERLLVEVFSLAEYVEAKRAGIRHPMWSSGKFSQARRLKIPILACSVEKIRKDPAGAEAYIRAGGHIMAFTTNDEDFVRENRSRATAFYTDSLRPVPAGQELFLEMPRAMRKTPRKATR